MHAPHFFPWGALALVGALLLGVFVAMGYGIIFFPVLFLLVALGGGAFFSFAEAKE